MAHASPGYAESGEEVDGEFLSCFIIGVHDVRQDGSGGGNTCDGPSSSVHGLKPHRSGVTIGPRSKRMKKPTVKNLSQL